MLFDSMISWLGIVNLWKAFGIKTRTLKNFNISKWAKYYKMYIPEEINRRTTTQANFSWEAFFTLSNLCGLNKTRVLRSWDLWFQWWYERSRNIWLYLVIWPFSWKAPIILYFPIKLAQALKTGKILGALGTLSFSIQCLSHICFNET